MERCMFKIWQGEVFYPLASVFTNLVPLSIQEYNQVTDNCQGGLIKDLGKTLMD